VKRFVANGTWHHETQTNLYGSLGKIEKSETIKVSLQKVENTNT